MADSTAVNKQVTIEEFTELLKIETLVELIQGEVRVSPSPSFNHQEVAGAIFLFLKTLGKAQGSAGMSPTVVYLDEETVIRPDIFWVSDRNTRCELKADGFWHGVPDLIVEVLDSSTEALDRGRKFDLYATNNVREYWLVNPQSEFIEVYITVNKRLTRHGLFQPGATFNSGTLGGIVVDIETFFAKQAADAGE